MKKLFEESRLLEGSPPGLVDDLRVSFKQKTGLELRWKEDRAITNGWRFVADVPNIGHYALVHRKTYVSADIWKDNKSGNWVMRCNMWWESHGGGSNGAAIKFNNGDVEVTYL